MSVIIPNRNYGRYLEEAISSALNQTHKKIEVIVVDNGSEDNSRQILKSFGTDIKAIFQNDQGQALARNNGIKVAQGQYIALLDADDYWFKEKIELQIQSMSKKSEFCFTASRQFEDESGKTITNIFPSFSGKCDLDFVRFPSRSIVPSGESTALLTRDLIERVGLFNYKLNSASGRDFFRRCFRYTEFSVLNEILCNYRIHGKNMSRNKRQMMKDTERAYKLLFQDPEWSHVAPLEKSCFRSLYWSHIKTYLKDGELTDAARESLKILDNI